MNEPLKRRNLVSMPPVETTHVSEDAIAEVAARNGFPASAPRSPAAPVASAAPQPTGGRRLRQPTGRDHQFNVRLRKDTLDFIYGQANDRNIPVAQVIEEAMEALRRVLSNR